MNWGKRDKMLLKSNGFHKYCSKVVEELLLPQKEAINNNSSGS
jgi:hypothetical protein